MTDTITKGQRVQPASLEQITLAETCFWWVTRAFLVVCVFLTPSVPQKIFVLLAILATFAVDIFHRLFGKIPFFRSLSDHLQTLVCVSAFFGAGIGKGLGVLAEYPDYDIFLHILAGFVGVFSGYYIVQVLRPAKKKSDFTFSVFFSLCFSGALTTLREITEFFIDFFTGRSLTRCYFISDDHWFFRLFGYGMSPYEQRPLFDTDEDMLISLVFSFISTGILYLGLRRKNSDLFHTAKEKTGAAVSISQRIKNKFALEYQKLMAETTVGDRLLWWMTRAAMIYAFCTMESRAEANLLLANLIGTFGITIIHFIAPSDSALCRLSYRTQTYITLMVLMGSYAGNYVFVYGILGRYDLFLHFISGFFCVLAGYQLALTLIRPETRRDNLLLVSFSIFLSWFIMSAHEVTEFLGDFIWGTSNQSFYWGPSDDSFFFKLFGTGAGNKMLYYLFDTMYDMLIASSAAIIMTLILFVFLEIRRRQSEKSYKTVTENQPVTC
ncbi:MAG: hypothetical protein ACI4GB_05460 [Acutalibacteraceae bacterium]